VELLSGAEILTGENYINLKLAAIFLLTGYISDYEKPMEASLRMVEEILPAYGFSQENVEKSGNLIKNCFAGIQQTLADNILHDARYDYLGRVDYLKLTDKLLRERAEHGKPADNKSWAEYQKSLLEKNEFITNTARILRNVPASDQIEALKAYSE
jgi:hypothetical protein